MPEKTKLLAVTELPVGAKRCLETPSGAIALFHTETGFHAIANKCPHRAGPLSDGLLDGDTVSCPWHQWKFRLSDGACANIPGATVPHYALEIIDGDVWLQH